MKLIFRNLFISLLALTALASCDRKYDTPMDDDRFNAGINDPKPVFYMSQYDPIADKGQYNHPDVMGQMEKAPTAMYGLYNLGDANRNNPAAPNGMATNAWGCGLQYHLLSQSYAGITNRYLAEGKTTTGTWMDAGDAIDAYKSVMRYHKTGPTWVVWTGNPLTNVGFDAIDGNMLGIIGRKYVLTDVVKNPESGTVAIVASHVYDAFIVDVQDKEFYDANGFTMAYDAREKTTEDSFREFKDKCNNNGLCVIPVHTAELADFAIANKLFVVNLNKKYNTAAGGQNAKLFKEVLAWLKPNSLVYGWEPGVGEDLFVSPVSASGNTMVAIGEFNLPWFSKDYKKMQTPMRTKIIDPHDIDYNSDKKYVAYYLSDGAHCGWMINGFVDNYYTDENVDKVNMNFGVCTSLVSQIAPLQMETIFGLQSAKSTLIESFGSGYWYSDNYAIDSSNRALVLKEKAEQIAAYMRQHQMKVLEQIAMDPLCPASMETYQALVDANDQLEGIVAIQYAPSYAGKGGEIAWVTNKKGYDIPIITVSYSIWNFGGYNAERDGTPTYIANKLNSDTNKYPAVIVHAWSSFKDTGDSADELEENASVYPNGKKGASAAEMCQRRVSDHTPICMQELIWRVRMEYKKEQTEKYLKEYI